MLRQLLDFSLTVFLHTRIVQDNMAQGALCTSLDNGRSSKRASHLKRFALGFTIVELLVVIVVIAILAAITIVAYNGITKQAVEASMKSDLRSATNQLELDRTEDGVYPSDASSANNGLGLKTSSSTQLVYARKGDGFCITVSNPQVTTPYRINSSAGVIEPGTCGAIVSTFAGSGTPGSNDGSASLAQFNIPRDLALDASGNLYVADANNHRIRKITPSGTVSTLAGSTAGFNNSTGSAAQFNFPTAVAVSPAGNVYVADSNNHRIRMVTPAGAVSTFAGSGSQGTAEGIGASAQFDHPSGIEIDSAGNLYVIDTWNSRLRKITPGGQVTTLAGSSYGYANGTGSAAQFRQPEGSPAVDGSGNIYVADSYGESRIRKVTSTGVVSFFAGSTAGYTNGSSSVAQFNGPYGLAVDTAGNVYVADYWNHRIRKITPSGEVSLLAGNGSTVFADGVATDASFNNPTGVTVSSDGTVYVADPGNHRIRKITQ